MGKFAKILQKYFEETPREELDKEWESIKPLNDIGPDVTEYAERVRVFFGYLMYNTQYKPTIHYSQENFRSIDEFYLAA